MGGIFWQDKSWNHDETNQMKPRTTNANINVARKLFRRHVDIYVSKGKQGCEKREEKTFRREIFLHVLVLRGKLIRSRGLIGGGTVLICYLP